MSDELAFAGAARQAEMVRAGEVSPTELVQLCLDRIARLDPQLNAFRKVFAEKALLEAEQAEARLKAGEERPLLGVPIAIKDEVDVAGEVNTHGTDGFTEPAKADCEMVRRLREAGAIVVGLTLLPELAICGFTESATYGVTRNPWNPQRTPGGSSGGSRRGGRRRPGPDRLGRRRRRLDPHPRRLLRPLRAEAAARPGLAGARPRRLERPRRRRLRQPHRARHARSGSTSSAGGSTEPGAPPPPGAALRRVGEDAARQAAGRLVDRAPRARRRRRPSPTTSRARSPTPPSCSRSLGHEVAQRDPDWGGIGNNITARFLRGVAEDVDEVPASRAARTPHPRLRPARPAAPRRRSSRRRCSGRAADAARVNAIFDSYDVLMTPVMGGTALPVRRWEGQGALRTVLGMSRFYPYCVPWNHLGNPAMAVPAGFAADGMPLSVQIVGRPGDEATLLSLAAQLEAERPWADRRPPIS